MAQIVSVHDTVGMHYMLIIFMGIRICMDLWDEFVNLINNYLIFKSVYLS
jgi:hypothetical protein